MIKSAVTVSLVAEARQGPFVFHEGLEDAFQRASALGFDAIEIFPPSPSALIVDDVLALCDQYKLKVAAVGTGAGFLREKLTLTSGDEDVRQRAMTFIEDLMTFAAGLNAPAIIGSMQGRFDQDVSRNQALAYLSTALSELGEQADALDQMLLYEPLNRYETNLFNRLEETAAYLETFDNPRLKILCDLFHASIEEEDIAASIRKAAPHIGHIHFADSNRRAIGFGHTPIHPIIDVLKQVGYHGYLSAEVLPLPDTQTAAEQTIKAFQLAVSR
jgi:sugar phosphate isomerase/epimerase